MHTRDLVVCEECGHKFYFYYEDFSEGVYDESYPVCHQCGSLDCEEEERVL